MDLIKKEAMEMEMVREMSRLLEAEPQRNVSVDAGSIESKREMVGFDDMRLQLLDRLTGGDSNRQIIPIVGMGGIGKTTLARNVFADKLIIEHFDICLWATMSQEFNIGHTLSKLLSRGEGNSSVAELGEELHKYLFGKRYLLVIDDMWSIEAWDKMRSFFPDCSKRSRVIVTTRMSKLAADLSNSSNSLCMSSLNEVDSWALFSKTVVGKGSVLDLKLREIGEKIVRKCKGLPLSIAVVGGLLAKSERTQGYWEYVKRNLSSIVNLENEAYCLRVLRMSYNHLPAYLKPCFLYMGVFDEDREIEISTIIKLWVSEGFVKPSKEKKSLESVAREYFQELVDRNLVLAHDEATPRVFSDLMKVELGSVGEKKLCRMHDLVRDLSLWEAKKQRFYYVYSSRNPPQDQSSHRRIVIPSETWFPSGMECWPHPRSYVCHDYSARLFPNFRLLRTLHTTYRGAGMSKHEYSQKDVFGLVNARFVAVDVIQDEHWNNVLHSSISWLWSLHTLLVCSRRNLEGPVEFWSMHQLKHVEFMFGRLRLQLPNNDNNIVIMENLQTLVGVLDFHLNEDVIRRIPNLTIFDVCYEKKMNSEVHCLSYLQRLVKLESFRFSIEDIAIEDIGGEDLQGICFPPSLKQIILLDNLSSPRIELEDILLKIGWLPFVEELRIQGGVFKRHVLETVEGQFPRLKTIELSYCRDLRKWTVSEASCFPLLEKILLDNLREVEEISSEIGDIATLELIQVIFCSRSAVLSAKKIVEEQEKLYGEDQLSFRVQVHHWDMELVNLIGPNFRIEFH